VESQFAGPSKENRFVIVLVPEHVPRATPTRPAQRREDRFRAVGCKEKEKIIVAGRWLLTVQIARYAAHGAAFGRSSSAAAAASRSAKLRKVVADCATGRDPHCEAWPEA
jgi:hypothetical protein